MENITRTHKEKYTEYDIKQAFEKRCRMGR